MTRVKGGVVTRHRHKKIIKKAKGYVGKLNHVYRVARAAVAHAGIDAYRGRKERKRIFRRLWITRVNAAVREAGMSYSRFIDKLKKAKIVLNRKMMAELAVHNPEIMKKVIEKVK